MKLFPFCLYLVAILLQAIFSSSSWNEEGASLSIGKKSGGAKPKKIVGRPVEKRRSTGVKKLQVKLARKAASKNSKAKNVVVAKEDKSKFLIEMLPKALVQIVIGYFNDDLYSRIVSIHHWALKDIRKIAVDSARIYVIPNSEGIIKGLNHSFGNMKEDERRLIEYGDSLWSDYQWSGSSHDSRYLSFCHSDEPLIGFMRQTKRHIKWLTQSNDPGDGSFKHVTIDREELTYGLLSRDGQALCSYSFGMNPIIRVYRLMEETGKNPVASMKFEINGHYARAFSGNGNRVIVNDGHHWLKIHDISKGTSKLVYKMGTTDRGSICALNEDGSEAAFFIGNELRVVEVDMINSSAIDQSAIVKVKTTEPVENIFKLVYSDGGKLHVLHYGGIVSLFDPQTKELVLLEAPQEGQEATLSAISPTADYVAFLRHVGRENGKNIYKTVVKRMLNDTDWKDLFGYKADENKQAAKP